MNRVGSSERPFLLEKARQQDGTHERQSPHWLPRLERAELEQLQVESSERLDLIAGGIRLSLKPNGSFSVAEQVLPLARRIELSRLPSRLGGGVLFVLGSDQDTWLFRADSFTSALAPIGTIDRATRAVTPGFEGIYATLRATGSVISVDPNTGMASAAKHLPHVPEYGSIAVVDDQFGGFLDPLRGLVLTHDGGENWEAFSPYNDDSAIATGGTAAMPGLASIRSIAVEQDRLLLTLANRSRFWLTRRGELRDAHDSSAEPARRLTPDAWVRRWKREPLGAWPIELAVTRGAEVRPGTAWVLAGGVLAEIRLRDGSVSASRRVAAASDGNCRAIRTPTGVYFVCHGAASTDVYRVIASGLFERVGGFEQVRQWVSAADGGLLFRGACTSAAPPTRHEYCVLGSNGSARTLRLGPTSGDARLTLVDAQTVAVVVAPRPNRSGTISLWNAASATVSRTRPIQLPANCSEPQRALLFGGHWSEQSWLDAESVSTWVTQGDDLMGVSVDFAGSMKLGEVVAGASRARYFENRVFIPDASGYALESLDGGQSYLRPRLPLSLTQGWSANQTRADSCTSVGCQLAGWLRVGWTEPALSKRRAEYEPIHAPELVRSARSRRHVPRLQCVHEPVPFSRAYLPELEASTTAGAEPAFARPPWKGLSPFYGVPAPLLARTQIGFERDWRSERSRIHAYAWGSFERAPTDPWNVLLRAVDPLEGPSVESARVTKLAFESAEAVMQAFGQVPGGENLVNWQFLNDSGGDGVIWSVEQPGHARAFLVQFGHEIQELRELAGREPRRISDAVHLRDQWVLLGTEPSPRLYAVAGADGQRVLSDFDPRSRLSASRVRLLKNRAATRLAYWVQPERLRTSDIEWYVYPIHRESGVIEQPLVVPLGRELRACRPDDDGWLLVTSPEPIARIEPSWKSFDASLRVDARLQLSAAGVCIDRLLFRGTAPRRDPSSTSRPQAKADLHGIHVDQTGAARRVGCWTSD